MTPQAAQALATLESFMACYTLDHPSKDVLKELTALEVMRRELGMLTEVAAIYHEGIERIGGRCDVRG